MAELTRENFNRKWNQKFANNEFQNITEATFREFKTDILDTFPPKRELTTNMIRGGLYRIPHVDALATIPEGMLIIGMEALAVNGAGAAEAGAGLVLEGVYFKLLEYSQGDVLAVRSVSTDDWNTYPAHWVRVSGTEEEKIASYPELQLENQPHEKGDVVKWTFPGGQTRLLEFKADSPGQYNPTPTGQDDDPNYLNFAALGSEVVEPIGLDILDALDVSTGAVPATFKVGVLYQLHGRDGGPVRLPAIAPRALALDDAYEQQPDLSWQPVSYNLVADTTSPRGVAAGQLELVRTGGTRQRFATWPEAHAAAEDGDEVVFGPGVFGSANQVVVIQKNLSLRLSENTTWQFSFLYTHTYNTRSNPRNITITGGQLQGTIFHYAEVDITLHLRYLRHVGQLQFNSYASGGSSIAPAVFHLLGVEATCPVGDYCTAYTRNGGFYFRPFRLVLEQSTVRVASGAVYHNTGSGGNATDAADNLLRLVDSTLLCAPDASVLVAPADAVTYDFSRVAYTGTLPAGIVASVGYSYLGMPAGGGGGDGPPAYILPAASTTVRGGVKLGAGLVVAGDVLSVADLVDLVAEFASEQESTTLLRIYADAAGTYQLHSSTGIGGISYKKNGAVVALPVALAAGDTLEILGTGTGTVRLRKQL